MRTFFVTLNWNTTALLERMVKSIEDTTPQEHVWIIVDNGSSQDEFQRLLSDVRMIFPSDLVIAPRDDDYTLDFERGPFRKADVYKGPVEGCIVISLKANHGCIIGHNLAFKAACFFANDEPYQIVMVDTDVEVYELGWLEKVLYWAGRRPEVGIIGLEHSREPCAPAIFLNRSGSWYTHQEQIDRVEPAESESVGLGLALIRWPVLSAGLRFDTGFKIYYKQDDDLCFQVRADLGLQVWAYPIDMLHYGSGGLKVNDYTPSSEVVGRNAFEQVKVGNQKYFAAKWAWLLRDRRATYADEIKHLDEMRQVMAQQRDKRQGAT